MPSHETLTASVSVLEVSGAGCLSAHGHGVGTAAAAAAATVAVGVLGLEARRHDAEGRVAGVDGVALRVHRVAQEVVGHRGLRWRRGEEEAGSDVRKKVELVEEDVSTSLYCM